ncbi:MAG: class III signal peptide-containing protein [Euryarchaeota archaeon]|jgi:hypothetical protein|uniref:class III signal peptide-containing protein n=1 Tax=Methanobacterium sp. MZD130B TaxID=3394378 RepID=UPI001754A024|nr:class III signal peptide-containing protein [Euryarchaeota archaeon]HHT19100.1 class III signal peptide-containing protein [Methanobacterium sp.]
MGIIEDEAAQTAAEFVLIFGGILVIVIIALIVYQKYINDMGDELVNGSEVQTVQNELQKINSTFK